MDFKIFLILLLLTAITSEKINSLRTIKELNVGLKMEWNALVALRADEQLNRILKSIELPKMLFTSLSIGRHRSVKDMQDKEFLVIVIINNEGGKGEREKRKIKKILRILLNQLQFTHILWVYQNANLQDLEMSSKQHWSQGYSNCIYHVNDSLYTFDPVPNVKVKQLRDITEYCNRKPINDFKGYPLSFPITASAPRCFRYTDHSGKIVYAGTFYRILRTFVDFYNFQFSEYPHAYGSFNYTALSAAYHNGKIDFFPNTIFYSTSVPKSDVIWNSRAFLLVPSPKPIEKQYILNLAFSWQLWRLNVFLYIVTSCIVGLLMISRKRKSLCNFCKAFLHVFNMFLNQPSNPIRTQSLVFRYFLITLMFYGCIISNSYLARLSSLLVSIVYEPKIETFKQFIDTDLRLLVSPYGANLMLNSSEVPISLLDDLYVKDELFVHKAIESLNNSYAHMTLDDKISFLLFQQKHLKIPLLHKIDSYLFSVQIYFTVRKDLPYILVFNRYLQYMAAAGLLMKITQDVNREGILSGQIRFLRDNEAHKPGEPLGLEYFSQTFQVFYCGCLLSLLVFLCEVGCTRCCKLRKLWLKK